VPDLEPARVEQLQVGDRTFAYGRITDLSVEYTAGDPRHATVTAYRLHFDTNHVGRFDPRSTLMVYADEWGKGLTADATARRDHNLPKEESND
jgi:hypothetical protein